VLVLAAASDTDGKMLQLRAESKPELLALLETFETWLSGAALEQRMPRALEGYAHAAAAAADDTSK
jgi:hypothetical protein